MSGLDKPKPIDQVLSGKVLTIGPEQIEALTEQELLGLDRPVHELVTNEESLKVPKAVRYLYEANDSKVPELLLARFGLNPELYDVEQNSSGLFAEFPFHEATRRGDILHANLRLLGIRTDERRDFFGEEVTGLSERLSPAFINALKISDAQRETFPFRHLGQFPGIQKSLQEIERLGGLKPEELFIEGHVPEVFAWRAGGDSPTRKSSGRTPVLLDEALRFVVQALSGLTVAEICRKNARDYQTVHKYFSGGVRVFSEKTLAVIAEKLKTVPGLRRGPKPVSPSE